MVLKNHYCSVQALLTARLYQCCQCSILWFDAVRYSTIASRWWLWHASAWALMVMPVCGACMHGHDGPTPLRLLLFSFVWLFDAGNCVRFTYGGMQKFQTLPWILTINTNLLRMDDESSTTPEIFLQLSSSALVKQICATVWNYVVAVVAKEPGL